jgi:hypothetical protein
VGSANGAVVGAALGVAGGLELGAGAAAILIPGVGPVFALGIVGAAILGTGGWLAGSKLGGAGDEKATEGVPVDEIFFYKDALRKGRSVLILMAKDDQEAARARQLLARQRAESIDAAREAWWIGLRDAEAEHYRVAGHDFDRDEQVYRAGFEAALQEVCRGKTLDEAADCLKWWYPNVWNSQVFRHGFARGRAYIEAQEHLVETQP